MSGVVIGLYGPDGTGKSTVATALEQRLSGHVVRMHHRPRLLPRSSDQGDPSQPHERAPRPMWSSVIKALYVSLDFSIGWIVRVTLPKWRGDSVIIERGWWDMSIDPRRYRISHVGSLISLLGRFTPSPDLNIILFADPEVLLERKQEITRDELQRQMAEWRTLGEANGAVFVDCSAPLEAVLQAILDAVADLTDEE